MTVGLEILHFKAFLHTFQHTGNEITENLTQKIYAHN